MSLLIDGYNLLHVSGILGRGLGPGGLERSRLALLGFLAAAIDPRELPRTTVVFDAHDAPRGLPHTIAHRGISIRFAAQYTSADEMIEELISADSAPRRLTVVSSDHRIQRAARRRRAKAIDSDVWFAELMRARREREPTTDAPTRPPVPLLTEDVEYWFRQFGGEAAFTDLLTSEDEHPSVAGSENKHPEEQKRKRKPKRNSKPESRDKEDARHLENPFPPGYGEDLLQDF